MRIAVDAMGGDFAPVEIVNGAVQAARETSYGIKRLLLVGNETALKADTQVQASAGQDPFMIAQKAVEIGQDLLNGKKPAQQITLLPSTLITRANVKDYKGWSAPR